MHLVPGNSVLAPAQPVPSTLASQGGTSSLVLVDFLLQESREEDLDLPSAPDTFEAARDL